MLHPSRCWCWLFHSLLNVPINYQALPIHPMNLLPSIASPITSNIADLFTKPLSLSRHRFTTTTLIGDKPPTPTTSVASTLVASTTTVDSLAAVVAPASVPSDSVPTLHPNLVPIALDTGASISRTLDFSLEIAQASYGLIQSPISVVSKALASTPVDPYTLITGKDTAISVDLSFPDSDSVDTVEFASTLVYSSFRHFGTATLVFLTDANSKLISVLVEPTQVDWIHWVPLPRLTPTDSSFHMFGRDYLQAFALFHLIPLWIALVSALLRSE